MKKTLTLIALLITYSVSLAQIQIDGDMLDWANIAPLDRDQVAEPIGDVPGADYQDFDLKHLYITHDSDYVYVRIDLADNASFENFYNFDNPPVFEFYMDTEIGDTTGFDWGWWNNAYNYYVNLAPTLHPDSTVKYGELYKYNGGRIPTWAEGEFEFLSQIPMAINDDANSMEFAIPRELVNFGPEFRPWVYSVGNWQWGDGADQLPTEGGEYMLRYDFWYLDQYAVVQAQGDQIDNRIQIDGDMLDWANVQPADQDEIAEELGDMPTGPEFDLKDVYTTSDSNNFYIRIDIDPSATFAGMYTNYPNPPAFQIFFNVNWGDTTGLGYGGFWPLAVDYMVDLSMALHPDSNLTEVPIYVYAADWEGAYETFEEVPDAYASFAVNDDDNIVEVAVPRAAINAGTDIMPWVYVVGNDNWDNEEYWPNTAVEGWSEDWPPVYYALDYNFISGNSVKKIADHSIINGVEDRATDYSKVKGFGLVRNYPNPFNPSTIITFQLSHPQNITVSVYNTLGQKVATLLNNKQLHAGTNNIRWNGKDSNGHSVTSGVYFYRISSKDYSITKKMMLLK